MFIKYCIHKLHYNNYIQVTWLPSPKSEAQALFVCRYVAPPGECYYNTLLCCKDYFSSSNVVSHAFSPLCVYSKFGHHPHPQATFVPNFVSLATSIAELAHGEKSHTLSFTQSPSLFDAPGTKALVLQNSTLVKFCWHNFPHEYDASKQQ